ncbi:MAG TPA: isocitrate/isopropylmalate family dehydrogenase [Vicinamibacteria bacterium]|nr:isocitrate/isopropylmalate family dehydrogenase [Vicinamibacteria bacterium]
MNAKERYQIVTLPGDGVGPEVTQEAVAVLRTAGARFGVAFDFEEIPGGGEYYRDHEREWPEGSEARCDAADAVLLGGVGAQDPATGKNVFTKPDKPYETPQLAGFAQVIGNRQRMQLFVNLRPIKLYPGVRHQVSGRFSEVWEPGKVDYVVCRENTEEAYTGRSEDMRDAAGNLVGRRTPLEVTRVATERVCRYAFELARNRKRAGRPGKVTCVVKSNIVGAHRYFEEVFRELGQKEFADLEQDVAMFDAFCMWQIRNPEWYDVVVAPNLVGDVISDNGSTTQGGMGLAAGGNIGYDHAMFEPVHGSAPKYKGLDKVNPMAAIMAGAMMCDWLGDRFADERLKKTSRVIEAAVVAVLASGRVLTYDLGGAARCSEVGQAVRDAVATASPS